MTTTRITIADGLDVFLDWRCLIGVGYSVEQGTLYQGYTKFCTTHDFDPLSANVFTRRLQAQGFVLRRGGKRVWRGVALKEGK